MEKKMRNNIRKRVHFWNFSHSSVSWKVSLSYWFLKGLISVHTLLVVYLSRLCMLRHPITSIIWTSRCLYALSLPLFAFAWRTSWAKTDDCLEQWNYDCKRKWIPSAPTDNKKKIYASYARNAVSIISIIDETNQKSIRSHPGRSTKRETWTMSIAQHRPKEGDVINVTSLQETLDADV